MKKYIIRKIKFLRIKLKLRIRNINHYIFDCRKRYSIDRIKHLIQYHLSEFIIFGKFITLSNYKSSYDEYMYYEFTEYSKEILDDENKHECCYYDLEVEYERHRNKCHNKRIIYT